MVKIILRMNLADFLNKPYEDAVIQKLGDVYQDSIKFYLILWYKDKSVSTKDLKQFLLKYESRLHFKTTVKVGNELGLNDFIWFDIIDENNANESDRVRFQYTYYNKENILKGLEEFHKCAKFCTSDKPAKIQKRNDYESGYSRK